MTLPFVRFLHWTVPAVDTAGWMRYFALRCVYLHPCCAFFHFACYIFNKLVQNEFMPQLLQIVLRISQNVCLKAITTKLVVAITEGDKASLLGSSDNRGLVSRINKEVRLVNPKKFPNNSANKVNKWTGETLLKTNTSGNKYRKRCSIFSCQRTAKQDDIETPSRPSQDGWNHKGGWGGGGQVPGTVPAEL